MKSDKKTIGDIAGDIDRLIKEEVGVSVPVIANWVAPEVKRLNDQMERDAAALMLLAEGERDD
jgi:hypothetical protein